MTTVKREHSYPDLTGPAEASNRRGRCIFPGLATQGFFSPGDVSHRRWGTASLAYHSRAWKRRHSFPCLALQGLSDPVEASQGIEGCSFPSLHILFPDLAPQDVSGFAEAICGIGHLFLAWLTRTLLDLGRPCMEEDSLGEGKHLTWPGSQGTVLFTGGQQSKWPHSFPALTCPGEAICERGV